MAADRVPGLAADARVGVWGHVSRHEARTWARDRGGLGAWRPTASGRLKEP